MIKACVIFITTPNRKVAEELAHRLVTTHLAACVNIVPAIISHYRWQGKIHRDREVLLIAKTTTSRVPALIRHTCFLHPNQVPEIIALPINHAYPPYLKWIADMVKSEPFILASASPQRRRLLCKLGLPFTVVPSGVSEHSSEKNPKKLVELLAQRKALDVSLRRPDALVLGADTIVYCAGQILGKPRDRKDSERLLRLLNGQKQKVYTGIAFVRNGHILAHHTVCTNVRTHKLSEVQLQKLIGKHMDKAGSYAVQDRDDPFIASIDGDHDNVIGLPVTAVHKLLFKILQAN